MQAFPQSFAIIDTETSGMRPPFSRIIDIGIIRVENGEVVERYGTLLNPGTSIPGFITRITSLTDEDLQDAPSFEDVALKIEELLKDAVFVAHNVSFDYNFVRSEFDRLSMPFSAETLCSVKLSRTLYPGARSHSLDALIDRHNLEITERHRALPDAEAVLQFFEHLSDEFASDDLADAVARTRQSSFRRDPLRKERIPKDTFTELPDSAGVYFFYGPEQELLYIGKSKHVRTRARSHFHTTKDKKERRLQAETELVDSVRTSGELSALILEAALIKAQSPLYNRALRKRRSLIIAKKEIADDGYARICLSAADTITPGPEVLAVFRTMAQARASLKKLAKEKKLCAKLLGAEKGSGACFAYQLEACSGACVQKIGPDAHNEALDSAFASRKLRTWPYTGVVMIDEKEREGAGTVFFVDNWALIGAYRYEDGAFSPFAEELEKGLFDYDTYKILVRYLARAQNKRTLSVLSKSEFRKQLSLCEGEPNELIEEEYVIR